MLCCLAFQEKIRKTMEEAFWDDVVESVKQDEPNFDRIISLMEEVRDELCAMAPESWKDNIVEVIDTGILSQVAVELLNRCYLLATFS